MRDTEYKKEYTVVTEQSIEELEKSVNEHLEKGFRLYHPITIEQRGYKTLYYQPMMRIVELKDYKHKQYKR